MNSIMLDLTKEAGLTLFPDDMIKLGRFSEETWVVKYGWFSYGGNRPQYGWYLISCCNPEMVKPLQLPDVSDIYMIR